MAPATLHSQCLRISGVRVLGCAEPGYEYRALLLDDGVWCLAPIFVAAVVAEHAEVTK